MRRAAILLVMLLGCGRSDPLFPRDPPPPVQTPLPVDAGPRDAGPIPDGGFDAGFPIIPCDVTSPCPSGFACQQGFCTLDGFDGELQITLTWQHVPRTAEDLDLHVIEPLADGGSCEIWYGDTNRDSPSACGAVGMLDLDANAGCPPGPGDEGADTENIIYPPHTTPPRGHYIVRVDYYEVCDGAEQVPFTVIVRRGHQLSAYPGAFTSSDVDQGHDDSGRTMVEFDEP